MSERRSTGEGTITRLPDATWWGQTSLGYSVVYDDRGRPLQRRRIRRSVRGRTRAEATPGTLKPSQRSVLVLRDIASGVKVVRHGGRGSCDLKGLGTSAHDGLPRGTCQHATVPCDRLGQAEMALPTPTALAMTALTVMVPTILAASLSLSADH
jgi:hypothetical protein